MAQSCVMIKPSEKVHSNLVLVARILCADPQGSSEKTHSSAASVEACKGGVSGDPLITSKLRQKEDLEKVGGDPFLAVREE
jgi:hypothetical protein